MPKIFLFFLLLASATPSFSAETRLLEDLPPYSVMVLCVGEGDRYDIKIAAFNQYNQIMLFGRASTIEKGEPWIKIGEKMTSGLAAKLVNHGEGNVTWEYLATTAGSSMIIIGENGSVRRFEELPKGVHKSPKQSGYLFLGKINALSELPMDVKTLLRWIDPREVEGMITSGKIQIK